MSSKLGFLSEGLKIIELAEKRDITLRLLGSCAVVYHCPKSRRLYDSLKRPLTDIDFMSYSKFSEQIEELLTELGYTRSTTEIFDTLYGKDRKIYSSEKVKVDVFYNALRFNHTIDFKNRLELDYPTITLADIFLEKMQIVHLTEKDIKDTIVLLREHEVGDGEKETINLEYVSKLLSKDWGFYYTVITNLNKVKDYLRSLDFLDEEDRVNVTSKIDKAIDRIEREPKSLGWKMRAKIGTKVRWYSAVG